MGVSRAADEEAAISGACGTVTLAICAAFAGGAANLGLSCWGGVLGGGACSTGTCTTSGGAFTGGAFWDRSRDPVSPGA